VDAGPDGARCRDEDRVSFSQGVAVVLVALERSSSMLRPLAPGGPPRLAAVQAALLEAVRNRTSLIGLLLYPGYFTTGCLDQCCKSTVAAPISEDPDRLFGKVFRCEHTAPEVCFQTVVNAPTADVLARARLLVNSFASDNRVLLIADGDPDCGAGAGTPCEQAVVETSALLVAKVRTTVLGLSSDAAEATCLPEIAEAGGVMDSVESVTAAGPLQTWLDDYFDDADRVSCRLTLRQPRRQDRELVVRLDGRPLERLEPAAASGADGWRFTDGGRSRIELTGLPCQRVLQGRVDIDIAETCCGDSAACRGL
jgi:hypothetical protein